VFSDYDYADEWAHAILAGLAVPHDVYEALAQRIADELLAAAPRAIAAGETMTKTTGHPISKHVDEYVKTLNWSPAATQDVKTIVIGNLRGFAAHLAAIESGTDILDDERVDKELRRPIRRSYDSPRYRRNSS
jgi:hypothetical protein